MSQHHKPCKTCPFSRSCTPGELGGSPAETFIGQCYGPFWIPCHECLDYSDPNWREQYHASQCAGVAIFRANCFNDERNEFILTLPADTTLVFASPEEFLAHHTRISIDEAKRQLEKTTPFDHYINERLRAGVQYML